MENKINGWKVASIILIVAIIGMSCYLYTDYKETYYFDGVTIQKNQLESITDQIGESMGICEIATGKCIKIEKLP